METKRSIIVTGGAGFIGSHTVVELIHNGYEPIIIDDFRNSEKFIIDRIQEIVGANVQVYNFDCTDKGRLQEVFSKHNPVGVIHFAADKAVGESVANPLKYYSNNLGSLTALLEVCVEKNVNNVVFSSSCTVYGEPEEIPVKESTPMGITASPYGYTKQVCERICRDTAYAHKNLNITLLRYFNPIGAHKSGLIGELPIGVPNNLIPYITQTAAGLREELTVHGNDYNTEDGTCIRDYIHVVDLANAHVKALDKKSEESISIYNVGTGIGSSVLDVINAFESVNNVKLNYKIGPRREGDAVSVYANNEKVVNELNWHPKYTLEDAMKDAWNWQIKLKSN